MSWWLLIHTLQIIEPHDMVVEYIGEIIGQNVSNYREKHYEKHGVDMYMFRMGVDEIVDATFKGNMARYINHSCEVGLLD